MKSEFKLDLINYVKKPVPLQPKSTKNLLSYTTYLVSPNKAVVTLQS